MEFTLIHRTTLCNGPNGRSPRLRYNQPEKRLAGWHIAHGDAHDIHFGLDDLGKVRPILHIG
jgi:hypothetical protein